jgi:hypothetical protein
MGRPRVPVVNLAVSLAGWVGAGVADGPSSERGSAVPAPATADPRQMEVVLGGGANRLRFADNEYIVASAHRARMFGTPCGLRA